MKLPAIFNANDAATELPEMEFKHLADFNQGDAGVFWSEPGGASPWELHRDCDELLQVIAGEIEVEILPEDGTGQKFIVSGGSSIVIPQGHWHRQTIIQQTREFYLTPGSTEHSMEADPRIQ